MAEKINSEIAQKYFSDEDYICYTQFNFQYLLCESPSFTSKSIHYLLVTHEQEEIVEWYNENTLYYKAKGSLDWCKYDHKRLTIDTDNFVYRNKGAEVFRYKVIDESSGKFVLQGSTVVPSTLHSVIERLKDGKTMTITKS